MLMTFGFTSPPNRLAYCQGNVSPLWRSVAVRDRNRSCFQAGRAPGKDRPVATYFHMSLVDPPVRRSWATPLPAQPPFDPGCAFLSPAMDRGMIDAYLPLAHHSLEITVADPIAALPAQRPKVPAKWRHLKSDITGTLCAQPIFTRLRRLATEPGEHLAPKCRPIKRAWNSVHRALTVTDKLYKYFDVAAEISYGECRWSKLGKRPL